VDPRWAAEPEKIIIIIIIIIIIMDMVCLRSIFVITLHKGDSIFTNNNNNNNNNNNSAILKFLLTYKSKSTNNQQAQFQKMFSKLPVVLRLPFVLLYIFGLNQSLSDQFRPIRVLTLWSKASDSNEA
jgi:hypothetical protein